MGWHTVTRHGFSETYRRVERACSLHAREGYRSRSTANPGEATPYFSSFLTRINRADRFERSRHEPAQFRGKVYGPRTYQNPDAAKIEAKGTVHTDPVTGQTSPGSEAAPRFDPARAGRSIGAAGIGWHLDVIA